MVSASGLTPSGACGGAEAARRRRIARDAWARQRLDALDASAFAERHDLEIAILLAWMLRTADEVAPPQGQEPDRGDLPIRFAGRGLQSTREERKPSRRAPGARVVLTERDRAILGQLAHDRARTVAMIAREHWSHCRLPEEKAAKRLWRLQAAGFVRVDPVEGGVVTLAPRGAKLEGLRRPESVHPQFLHHHLATLRAIERFEGQLRERGGHLVPIPSPGGGTAPYLLERDVLSRDRRGAFVRGGQFDLAPDAVVHAAFADGQIREVAIEYFTRSYSTSLIREKAELHQRYDQVVQVADTPATADRVARVTGHSCEVLG